MMTVGVNSTDALMSKKNKIYQKWMALKWSRLTKSIGGFEHSTKELASHFRS